MSLMSFSHGPFCDHYDRTLLNEAMRELRHCERPYWIGHQNPLNLANAVGKVQNDKDKYAVSVDVSHFKPNELKVTTTGHEVVIEGKHEEKTDEHGQIERRFVRKYMLPKDVSVEAVVSHLSRDGILTVSAPKAAIEGPTGRVIPIQPSHEEHPKHKAVEQHK
uniref:SHSP domain-containing protein n=1 Tax=Plectus sambesii TaxID=2011161 RepID=A0A914XHU0_9BILA